MFSILINVKRYFTLPVGPSLEKNRLLVIFLLLVCFSASAEDAAGEADEKSAHLFSVGFSLGLLSGTSEEIVYRSSSANSYLSQLVWRLNPLFYAGVDAGYSWQSQADPESVFGKIFSGFFVDASFKYGLPGDTGLMEDKDWLRQPTWAISHYSIHNNNTETALLAGFDIGKSFKLYNEFRLGVFLSYNLMYYSFIARGGTFLYPEIDGGHYSDSGSDNVVTYRQLWQILSPGVSFYGVFNSYFNVEIFLKATPLITASSFDEHLSRTLQIINDPMYFGLYIEPGLVFSFMLPGSKFMLSFSLNYRNISGTRGDSKYRYPDNLNFYRNVGGADYSTFDIGIIAKFVIF